MNSYRHAYLVCIKLKKEADTIVSSSFGLFRLKIIPKMVSRLCDLTFVSSTGDIIVWNDSTTSYLENEIIIAIPNIYLLSGQCSHDSDKICYGLPRISYPSIYEPCGQRETENILYIVTKVMSVRLQSKYNKMVEEESTNKINLTSRLLLIVSSGKSLIDPELKKRRERIVSVLSIKNSNVDSSVKLKDFTIPEDGSDQFVLTLQDIVSTWTFAIDTVSKILKLSEKNEMYKSIYNKDLITGDEPVT